MATETRTRRRPRRALDTQPVEDREVLNALERAAADVYAANKAKNAASKKEKDASTVVLGLLQEHKINKHDFNATIDGSTVRLEAELMRSSTVVLDAGKLLKLVGQEVFTKCVKAQVGLIKTHAGEAMVSKVKSTAPNGYTAKVGVKK